MKDEKIVNIPVYLPVHTIECQKCHIKFVLIGIMWVSDKIETFEQAKSNYCPYCGERQEN